MDESKEYKLLDMELKFCRKLAENSEICDRLPLKLLEERAVRKKINRILTSAHRKMRLMAYNIGSIQFSWASKFRLSICLVVKNRIEHLIEGIDIVDPTTNSTEREIMRNLGCNVLPRNRPIRVQGPTLVYLPYADPLLLESLLEANWCTAILNQLAFLGIRRLNAIAACVKEINLCGELDGVFRGQDLAEVFNDGDDDGFSFDYQEEFTFREGLEDVHKDKLEMYFMETVKHFCPPSALHYFKLAADFNVEALVPRKEEPEESSSEGGRERSTKSEKEEVQETKEAIKETEAFMNLLFVMRHDPEVKMNISRILAGPHKSLNLVIYGLGSLEVMYTSQFDLAFALLLKEESILPIEAIEVFDPYVSSREIRVLMDLGVRVVTVDDRCRRRVDRPTIFFAPRSDFWLVGNILEANFFPERLNKMVFIITSLYHKREVRQNEYHERLRYLWAIEKYKSKDVRVFLSSYSSYAELRDFKINFYNIIQDKDLKALLADISFPKRFHCDYFFDQKQHDVLISRVDTPGDTNAATYNWLDRTRKHTRRPAASMTEWQLPVLRTVKLNFHGYADGRKGWVDLVGVPWARRGSTGLLRGARTGAGEFGDGEPGGAREGYGAGGGAGQSSSPVSGGGRGCRERVQLGAGAVPGAGEGSGDAAGDQDEVGRALLVFHVLCVPGSQCDGGGVGPAGSRAAGVLRMEVLVAASCVRLFYVVLQFF
ncbi:hypothetical protein HPP92_020796 [Vanilla planifolia]|uniref:SRR1-like domain-containing protein n=1 Tax=Vanilla planifolia TaxID=51239 RepID=A0A835PZT9_VANPL|nr:hypothetical protein HPP92_020796 [Vanilla planifolia]